MEHHHHHHHPTAASPASSDRLPQWTHAETSDLLSIRAELDRAFMETKRNKPLWESVAARMQLNGHSRTPDQCKSKWKNLVTRFKGASDFPFRNEMQRIYDERRRLGKSEEGRSGDVAGEVMEVGFLIREVGRRQREMEERWAEEEEKREAERRAAEEEWRRGMEALWEERAEMERRWRARAEERRARAEERAERRHQLITVLLTRLIARDGG